MKKISLRQINLLEQLLLLLFLMMSINAFAELKVIDGFITVQNLNITNQITIQGGSPAANKVLTSTGTTGLAEWKSPTWMGGGGNATYLPKFTTSTAIGDSIVSQTNATLVDINGQVRIRQGGSPANGKVLTSTDSTGLAIWQTPSTWMAGAGTANKIPKFTGNATLGDSVISESSGNIGIGTTAPGNLLHVKGTGSPGIILEDADGSTSRPSITFKGNDLNVFQGDDQTNEVFDFYSDFQPDGIRTYDAVIRIHGRTPLANFGKYLSLWHDGTDGRIATDVGNIIITPTAGNLQVNGQVIATSFSGSAANLTNLPETDPQVGTITANYVPKWDGTSSALVTGTIYDNGYAIGIGATTPQARLDVTGSYGSLRVGGGTEMGIIQYGIVGDCSTNLPYDGEITFSRSYTSPPAVFATVNSISVPPVTSIIAYSSTNTNFRYRTFYGGSESGSCKCFSWLAIGD